jgi:esterase/lipase superfamily enzyme
MNAHRIGCALIVLCLSSTVSRAQTNLRPLALNPEFFAMPVEPPGTAATSSEPNKDNALIRVFYTTNRAFRNKGKQFDDYSTSSSNPKLSFGVSTVSIPRDHRMGVLESASVWKFEFRNNPKYHVAVREIEPRNEERFFKDLRARITKSMNAEVLIFVHGFDVTFEDSLRRTAQLSYDLGFDGAPIAFTWPSEQVGAAGQIG